MFDFIPVQIYSNLFYQFMLFMIVVLSLLLYSKGLDDSDIKSLSANIGVSIVVLITVYMGSRLPTYAFGDTGNYNKAYQILQHGGELKIENDYVFNYFMLFCSKIMSARFFFFLDAVIYVVPMYLFSRKYGGSYWLFTFIMFAASYSFWPYGVNGLRNGMATSVFILGLVYYEKKWLMHALFALSFGIHNSLIIPIAAFITAGVYKNPKVYFYIWLASIPLSLAGGGFWGTFFTSLGLGDERAGAYLNAEAINNLAKNERTTFSQTGFRWDFVLYSAAGVFAGWYFLIKHKVQDKFYIHLWGIYVIANAFWILVIRAAFSNRFAYLSWFLMAPVIIYPLLRYRFSRTQNRIMAAVLLLYYLFTYVMYFKG
ncbi:MAG: EpsG family protein [Weeksellaceae bacterium]|nr:EpsG family protein [Weeksellaceae bacterium]